ncbi:MAG TPA: SufD family Fe-S cluster assembly protein [Synergistaceae bacterium]|nr:SufD family Fe-S cluster assembly protein [Synergistaceae bacterium]
MTSKEKNYEELVSVAQKFGGRPGGFGEEDAAYIVLHANSILASHTIPGIEISSVETPEGIDAIITVKEGYRIDKPVRLCFGHLGTEGVQRINSSIHIEKGAKATFLSYCVFPNAVQFLHAMEGDIVIDEDGDFTYEEIHVHGPEGHIDVRPKTTVLLRDRALYRGDFSLVEGRVGSLDIHMEVTAQGEKSRVELTSKVYGKYNDSCKVRDIISLTGKESSALIKARVVLKDQSHGTFVGLIDGAAPGARGHVDCAEVIQGEAKAEASPVVRASHPEAEVTHEAAIGRIANDKIEGLMAKGLDEDQAVDIIVSGLLR